MVVKVHFRRCHKCSHTNSVDSALVTVCQRCGKHLAPFYFFDESRIMGIDNVYFSAKEAAATSWLRAEYPPVMGLTAYWES